MVMRRALSLLLAPAFFTRPWPRRHRQLRPDARRRDSAAGDAADAAERSAGTRRARTRRWPIAGSPSSIGTASQRAMLIASVPGDEASVAAAVPASSRRGSSARSCSIPALPDAGGAARARVRRAGPAHGLPVSRRCTTSGSMTRTSTPCSRRRRAIGARCSCTAACCRSASARSSGCRAGSTCGSAIRSPSRRWPCGIPSVPVVIPHFGAGLFREALMAADAAPNIVLDTSSSNSWIRLHPGLTLARRLRARARLSSGPSRLLFGTDSSFFPRGWQRAGLRRAARDSRRTRRRPRPAQARIFGGNFVATVRGPADRQTIP